MLRQAVKFWNAFYYTITTFKTGTRFELLFFTFKSKFSNIKQILF